VNTLVDTYLGTTRAFRNPDIANFFDQRTVRIRTSCESPRTSSTRTSARRGIIDLEQQPGRDGPPDDVARARAPRNGQQIAQRRLVSELEDALAGPSACPATSTWSTIPWLVPGRAHQAHRPALQLRQKIHRRRPARPRRSSRSSARARVADSQADHRNERFELSQIRQNLRKSCCGRAPTTRRCSRADHLAKDVEDCNKEIVTIDKPGRIYRSSRRSRTPGAQNAMKQRDQASFRSR
jgi:hypothetical protein